mmetsp:Transcript_36442/g.43887  ORF Transcript_36442/g.43887 Transcript_36442/m.43887 type:complete len:323 (-) Transcript_36442:51-1019(-)
MKKCKELHSSCARPAELIKSFVRYDWNSCIARCRSHPAELKWRGKYKQTPLHCICFRRPPTNVIKAMLIAYPEAAQSCDMDLCTPLHYAMSQGSSHDVIIELIRCAPNTVNQPNRWNYTPIYWFWKRCEKHMYQHGELSKTSDSKDWRILKEMIWITTNSVGSIQDQEYWPILHVVAKIKCPVQMLKGMIQLFPNELITKDNTGRLPLSIAAHSESLGNATHDHIKVLIEAYKGAASEYDATGSSPLTLAIKSGKTWDNGIELIFCAAPNSIRVLDQETKLYAFMLAGSCESHACCMTTTFELLRKCPELACRSNMNLTLQL